MNFAQEPWHPSDTPSRQRLDEDEFDSWSGAAEPGPVQHDPDDTLGTQPPGRPWRVPARQSVMPGMRVAAVLSRAEAVAAVWAVAGRLRGGSSGRGEGSGFELCFSVAAVLAREWFPRGIQPGRVVDDAVWQPVPLDGALSSREREVKDAIAPGAEWAPIGDADGLTGVLDEGSPLPVGSMVVVLAPRLPVAGGGEPQSAVDRGHVYLGYKGVDGEVWVNTADGSELSAEQLVERLNGHVDLQALSVRGDTGRAEPGIYSHAARTTSPATGARHVLDASTNRHYGVDYDLIHPDDRDDIVESRDDEVLYRFTDEPPEQVFRFGFSARSPQRILNINDWQNSAAPSAQFVSTTRNDTLWHADSRYRYTIDSSRNQDRTGVDVNATRGIHLDDNAGESEIAFTRLINARAVARVYDSRRNRTGRWDRSSQKVVWESEDEPEPLIDVVQELRGKPGSQNPHGAIRILHEYRRILIEVFGNPSAMQKSRLGDKVFASPELLLRDFRPEDLHLESATRQWAVSQDYGNRPRLPASVDEMARPAVQWGLVKAHVDAYGTADSKLLLGAIDGELAKWKYEAKVDGKSLRERIKHRLGNAYLTAARAEQLKDEQKDTASRKHDAKVRRWPLRKLTKRLLGKGSHRQTEAHPQPSEAGFAPSAEAPESVDNPTDRAASTAAFESFAADLGPAIQALRPTEAETTEQFDSPETLSAQIGAALRSGHPGFLGRVLSLDPQQAQHFADQFSHGGAGLRKRQIVHLEETEQGLETIGWSVPPWIDQDEEEVYVAEVTHERGVFLVSLPEDPGGRGAGRMSPEGFGRGLRHRPSLANLKPTAVVFLASCNAAGDGTRDAPAHAVAIAVGRVVYAADADVYVSEYGFALGQRPDGRAGRLFKFFPDARQPHPVSKVKRLNHIPTAVEPATAGRHELDTSAEHRMPAPGRLAPIRPAQQTGPAHPIEPDTMSYAASFGILSGFEIAPRAAAQAAAPAAGHSLVEPPLLPATEYRFTLDELAAHLRLTSQLDALRASPHLTASQTTTLSRSIAQYVELRISDRHTYTGPCTADTPLRLVLAIHARDSGFIIDLAQEIADAMSHGLWLAIGDTPPFTHLCGGRALSR